MSSMAVRAGQLLGAGVVAYGGITLFRRQGSASPAEKYDYVVVGGGNAGGYACKEFVDLGINKTKKICMISSEADLPYERPALSKGYLLKPQLELPMFNTCAFAKQRNEMDWYKENNIDVKLGTTVDQIDFKGKSLKANGAQVAFDKILLATGCGVVKFSDFMKAEKCQFDNIFYLRDIVDARAIKKNLSWDGATGKKGPKKECVVIGGGYIGMEITSAMLANPAFREEYKVTMVFPEEHMMAARNLFTPAMAAKYHELYETNGVTFVCNDWDQLMVDGFEGKGGKVSGVVMKGGQKLPADMVIVGIGARPNTGLFKEKLDMDKGTRGLKVDKYMKTSDSNVYGCGDIASFPCPWMGNKVTRLEHVRHARSSAAFAVRAMTNKLDAAQKKTGYEFLPVFYSRIFGQSWEFYGEVGQKDTCVAYAKNTGAKGDPLNTRMFSMCAVWSDKNGKVTAMLVDTDEGEDKTAAADFVQRRCNLKEAERYAASKFGRKL